MSTQQKWEELKAQIAYEAIRDFRYSLAKSILVGPVNNDDPSGDHTIIFGEDEFKIGRFATRHDACNAANAISDAIEQHRMRK